MTQDPGTRIHADQNQAWVLILSFIRGVSSCVIRVPLLWLGPLTRGRSPGYFSLLAAFEVANLVLNHLLHTALGDIDHADGHCECRGHIAAGQTLQGQELEGTPGVGLDA